MGGKRVLSSLGSRSMAVYTPSNSFRACSNFSSWRRLAFSSSSPSAISALSLSACSKTTSTGVFFFHGLRLSALEWAAAFGSFFGAGIFLLLLFLEFFLLLVDPRFQLADRFAFGRQF